MLHNKKLRNRYNRNDKISKTEQETSWTKILNESHYKYIRRFLNKSLASGRTSCVRNWKIVVSSAIVCVKIDLSWFPSKRTVHAFNLLKKRDWVIETRQLLLLKLFGFLLSRSISLSSQKRAYRVISLATLWCFLICHFITPFSSDNNIVCDRRKTWRNVTRRKVMGEEIQKLEMTSLVDGVTSLFTLLEP
jgi:hypothetical protein